MKNLKVLFSFLLVLGTSCPVTAQEPYRDTHLSSDVRACDLVSRMTLDEKISQMRNTAPAIERFGLHAFDWWSEALHGVARAGTATVFPQSIGMAASFDPMLLFDVFTAVSDEARAKNTDFARSGKLKRYQGLSFWTPNVNIFRDPRWGRGQETYGEDPYLASVMGMNVVRGLQGPSDSRYAKLLACAKHFAVHSGPEWNRHSFNAENISPRDLWETYLPAFKALVQKAGVREVMCAYNRYEGEPCCGSNRLLHQILRDEWGFRGIVVSDCWAISDFYEPGHHETEPDSAHASARAVGAGTDLECGDTYASLSQAVSQGLISEAAIDTSLVRLMKARIDLGELDDNVEWRNIPMSVVSSREHAELASRMALESMVLLQNRNHLLPLDKGIKIALVGPNANDSVMQWGNYNGYPVHTVTLYEALKSRLPGAQLFYEQGCDHTAAVQLQSVFDECSIDGERGFRAEYWNTMTPGNAKPDVVTHVSSPIHFTTMGATVFAPGVNLGDFSGTYTTVLRPKRSETVVFSLQTQGTMRLRIDGKLVFQGLNMKNNHCYELPVVAGKEYKIEIDYIATEGNCATLNFDFGREIPSDLMQTVDRVKAADVDVIVFAGGISPMLEGEEMPIKIEGFDRGDRDSIGLPRVQAQLIEALRSTGKPVVLVNFSGSAMSLTREAQLCDAIVQAWYPGQDGGDAVASVLFGDYNPAGRLPVTVYKGLEQLPDFSDYSMKGRTYRYFKGEPLFRFGHGLSYTTFEYGKATLSADRVKRGSNVTLTIPVSNVGGRDGEEVVQVYVSRPDDAEGPTQTLRAFKRVAVKKGATTNVTFELTPDQFEWFDTGSNTMRELVGRYVLHYGGTSDPNVLSAIPVDIVE